MKSWYDKKGRLCFGRARGGIKAALESVSGFAANTRFFYIMKVDSGGLHVYRWRVKKDGTIIDGRESVYYRAYRVFGN